MGVYVVTARWEEIKRTKERIPCDNLIFIGLLTDISTPCVCVYTFITNNLIIYTCALILKKHATVGNWKIK